MNNISFRNRNKYNQSVCLFKDNIIYIPIIFINEQFHFLCLAITRASGYYFYSYDSTEVFDPNSPNPNNLIYHQDPMSGCPASIQNITVNRLAQEIVFINKRPTGYRSSCTGADLDKTTVEICEVRVMGKILVTI